MSLPTINEVAEQLMQLHRKNLYDGEVSVRLCRDDTGAWGITDYWCSDWEGSNHVESVPECGSRPFNANGAARRLINAAKEAGY